MFKLILCLDLQAMTFNSQYLPSAMVIAVTYLEVFETLALFCIPPTLYTHNNFQSDLTATIKKEAFAFDCLSLHTASNQVDLSMSRRRELNINTPQATWTGVQVPQNCLKQPGRRQLLSWVACSDLVVQSCIFSLVSAPRTFSLYTPPPILKF